MRPGEIVAGRYEIESRTGTGGMGVVYRAHDRDTRTSVAIKLVRQQEIESVDRFADEVDLLARLTHPHIVGYITHGISEAGLPYLVMPWLDGVDLQHRIESSKLGIIEALNVARSVADALAYLHERGFVHRDLKPSNIFLEGGAFDRVRVLDFGIARAMMPTRQITVSGVLIGTPGYMAPEQARGDRELTPAVDVFALGCVLFECLAGRPLFTGKHMMAVLAKVLFEEPLRLREVRSDAPPALDALIKEMVAKDPAERVRDGAQLRSMIDELLVDPKRLSAPPSSVARLTRNEQRMVSVMVALLAAPARETVAATPISKSRPIEKLDAAASKFAVRLECLADGTAIALAVPGYAAADQAALLARFARYIAASMPDSVIAIATGRAVTDGRLPVGEAIERGVKIANASASEGGVHLDDATASLITSRFQIQRDGASLQLHDEVESLDPARPLLGAPTRCVGRDRELAILQATSLECLEEGGARAVLVTGAAGIGKSRLRHEFARRLQAQAAVPTIWQCRGDPLHVSTPYALTAQIAREAAGIRPGDRPEQAQRRLLEVTARLSPAEDAERVAEFLGELVSAPFEDENRLQLRAARKSASAMGDQIRRAFEDLIRASSAEHPLVLLMDDLHWADSGSIKLIDNVLRKLRKEPLLVVAMARDEIYERFPTLWRERDLVTIRLPPLAVRACAKLARESLGENAPDGDVERIVERCEGNAFFLEELIRATSEGGAHRLLPETILAVAEARLERMSPSCRRILRAASVFGEIFWQEALAVLVDDAPAEREALLATLMESEAIVAREAPRFPGTREYAFRHALFRSAVYATLTEEDRRLGHRLAAEWLRGVEEEPETVAIHWLEGAEPERAAACFEAAGWTHWGRARADAAARCGARSLLFTQPPKDPIEVVTSRMRLLALALDVTRGLDEKEIVDGLEEHLRRSETAAEGRGLAYTAIERVASVLRDTSAETSIEALALAGCIFGAMADVTSARTMLEEASRRAKYDLAQRQKIAMMEAKVACWAGEFGRADDLLSRASLAGNALDDSAEALMWLASATVAVGGKGKLPRALEYVSRAESIGRSVSDNPVFQTLCHKTRFLCFFFGGDCHNAAASASLAIAVARQSGLRFEECLNLHNLAELCIRLDEHARARDALERSLTLAVELGRPEWLEAGSRALLAYLDGINGDRDADRRLESHAADFGRSKLTWLELTARYWLGLLFSSRGDPRARGELSRALEMARKLDVRVYEQDCLAALERAPAPDS